MQKLLSASAVVMLLAGMVGCQSQEPAEMAAVPPPAFAEGEEDFAPVVVEDYDEPEPVADGGEPAGASEPVEASEPAAPAPSGAGGTTYTVRRGDTLWSIAQRHYGDGTRMRDIIDANPSIQNPDQISAGQEIILP